MAKGEGGGGHFAERARERKPTTGYYDDPAVLAAITKPRSKPLIVERKKKRVISTPVSKPSRVKTDSDPGTVWPVSNRTAKQDLGKVTEASPRRASPLVPKQPRTIADLVSSNRYRF